MLAFEHLDPVGARAATNALDVRCGDAARHLPIAGACFGSVDMIDTADSRPATAPRSMPGTAPPG